MTSLVQKTEEKKPVQKHNMTGLEVLNNSIQSILEKMMSGRWIATVVIASSFAYLAASGKIDQKDVVLVVMTVISFYFGKTQSKK
jgi:hypothetical protein